MNRREPRNHMPIASYNIFFLRSCQNIPVREARFLNVSGVTGYLCGQKWKFQLPISYYIQNII